MGMEHLARIVSYASGVAGLLFAVFAFINGGLSRRSIFMALTMGSMALWAVSIAVMYGIENEATVVGLAVLNYAVICFMEYSMVMLGLSFTNVNNKKFWLVGVVVFIPAMCLMIAMILDTGTMFTGAIIEDGMVQQLLQNDVGYSLFAILITIYTVVFFLFMNEARKQTRTEAGRRALMMMIIGAAIAFATGIIFNLAIPMFLHDYTWGWVGPMAILVFAGASYRAVVKFAQDEL